MSTPPEKDNVDQHIDMNLRRVFKDMLEQDVPDRFKILLDELRAQESSPKPEHDE